MDNESLATEMLREIKATSKRWFIAFCVMVGLEFATIGAFIWYITLPVDDTSYTQTVDDIENSDIKQSIGDDDNGKSNTDSTKDSESHEK